MELQSDGVCRDGFVSCRGETNSETGMGLRHSFITSFDFVKLKKFRGCSRSSKLRRVTRRTELPATAISMTMTSDSPTVRCPKGPKVRTGFASAENGKARAFLRMGPETFPRNG